MSKSTILTAVLLLAAASLHAQAPATGWFDRWVIGAGVLGAGAVGPFHAHADGGVGGELMMGFQPHRRHGLVLRANVGGMMYDRLRATGYEQTCGTNGCWSDRVRYNARSHSMLFAQAGPELMRTDGTWRPFAYVLAGGTWFSSRANQRVVDYASSRGIFWSRNVSGSYGGGLRRVTTRRGRERGFELSLRMMHNPGASYVTEDAIYPLAENVFVIVPHEGSANLLMLRLGFWLGPHVRPGER